LLNYCVEPSSGCGRPRCHHTAELKLDDLPQYLDLDWYASAPAFPARNAVASEFQQSDGPLTKPLELPPKIAPGFVSAMRAFFGEKDPTRRDAIAVHQLHVLCDYQNPREPKLKLDDVKELFEEMRNII
jgi:hypothetical protein